MKAQRIIALFLATFVLVFGAPPTHGQGTIIFHQGATDPVTEGFAFSGHTTLVGPVFGDLGMDAWTTRIVTNQIVSYSQSLTPQQQAQAAGADWILSATLRIVQTAGFSRGNTFAAFYLGTYAFPLNFGANSNGDPFVHFGNASATPMFVLDGAGSTYHNYQLRYDATSGTADLWVDGAERFTGISGIPGFAWWGLTWGEGQGGLSQANWNRVSLEVIPEPSSLVLLSCGGVFLAAALLRRGSKR